ncbi:MAG TPA: PKD domain-containing protein, partial [Thermoplasmata archaeon]|nr:PKD domain-containing protein [Thermoplasmata archaeon]
GAMLTFSGVDNAVFLFGGNGTRGALGDVWRYATGKWANQTGGFPVLPRARTASAALDSSIGWLPGGTQRMRNGFLLLFGGGPPGCVACPLPANNDTWVLEPAMTTVATGLPTVIEVREPTSLSATVSGGSPPYRLSWQFGDGTGSVSTAPVHSYSAIGNFTVTVSAIDLAGVSEAATVAIAVVAGPNAAASVSRTTTDVGRSLWFNGTAAGGTAPYSFAWSFGDGGTFVGGSTTHTYGTTGTFHGNLSVTDAVGGVGVQSFAVTVNPAMTVFASPPTGSLTAGVNVTFRVSVNAGTPPYSVNWSFGDGANSPSPTVVHIYTTGGTYQVRLIVSDAAGARQESNFTLEVVNVTRPGGGGPGGITTTDWAIIIGVLVAAAVVVAVYLRRRRPRHPRPQGPIAAAAVGEAPWDRGEDAEASRDSRSARRSAQRWIRR